MNDLKELVDLVIEARPHLEIIIQQYGPLIKQTLTDTSLAVCDIRAAQVKRFEELGFSHQEAILLTLDARVALEEALNRVSDRKR